MNVIDISRRGLWLVAGSLLFSLPSASANVVADGGQLPPDFGVIQFTDDEAFIDLPVPLAEAWGKTLEVVAAMNPAVKADLPYLENNGHVIADDLMIAVEVQGDLGHTWVRVRVALPAGQGAAARTRAEILLDAIADRLEPAHSYGPPAPQQAPLPPVAEGFADQDVVNNYYYYGSEPYAYGNYYEPYPFYGSYYGPSYYSPWYYGSSGWGWGVGVSIGWGWGWGCYDPWWSCGGWWSCSPWWGWNGCGWNSCGWNNSCAPTTVVINNNLNGATTVLDPRTTSLALPGEGSGRVASARAAVARADNAALPNATGRTVRRAPETARAPVLRTADRSRGSRPIVVYAGDRTQGPRPSIVTASERTPSSSPTRTVSSSSRSVRSGPSVTLGSVPYGSRMPGSVPTRTVDAPRSTPVVGGSRPDGRSAPTATQMPGGSSAPPVISYPTSTSSQPTMHAPSSSSSRNSAPAASAPRTSSAPAPRASAPAPAPRASAPAPRASSSPSLGGGGHSSGGSRGTIGGGSSGGSSGGRSSSSGSSGGGRPR